MTTLHLVFSTKGLDACYRRRAPDDAIVLMADAAYAAQVESDLENTCVMAEDLALRGVENRNDLPTVTYSELVQLTLEHSPIVSWDD